MKHVFGVASHIAFYLSNKIVEQDNLSREDCVFLLLRGYELPEHFRARYPHQIHTQYNTRKGEGRVFCGLNFPQTARNIAAFDALIDTYLHGEPFVWYTQVCNNDICSLMVSKQNCVGYYVIEDGSGSYRDFNPQTFTGIKYLIYRLVLLPLWPRIFCAKNHFIESNHAKFKGCIASSDRCFPLHQDCLRVVGNPYIAEPLPVAPDAVIAMDSYFVLFTDTQTEDIIRRMANVINHKGYQHVVYKHHPAVTTPDHKKVYEQYENWIHQYFTVPIEELPVSACLENILTAHPCDFYTVFSSVAIYAHTAGCRCYSMLPQLRNYTDVKVGLIEEISLPME